MQWSALDMIGRGEQNMQFVKSFWSKERGKEAFLGLGTTEACLGTKEAGYWQVLYYTVLQNDLEYLIDLQGVLAQQKHFKRAIFNTSCLWSSTNFVLALFFSSISQLLHFNMLDYLQIHCHVLFAFTSGLLYYSNLSMRDMTPGAWNTLSSTSIHRKESSRGKYGASGGKHKTFEIPGLNNVWDSLDSSAKLHVAGKRFADALSQWDFENANVF